MHKHFQSFVGDRFQRVVTNGQSSNWSPTLTGVPQGSMLRSLVFLMYINDLLDNLESLENIFAADTSLFSTIYNHLFSSEILNKDLINISKWANQWKCFLTHIQLNKHRKLCSHVNLREQTIPQSILMMLH